MMRVGKSRITSLDMGTPEEDGCEVTATELMEKYKADGNRRN